MDPPPWPASPRSSRQRAGGWRATCSFPPEVIRYAVWLYFRFTLSFRDVEELLAQRGIEVSYEISFPRSSGL